MTAITAVSAGAMPRAERYRLTEEQILTCCAAGYELGFRTFVLQGGEDPYFTDEKICDLVSADQAGIPGLCSDTLDRGKIERASYQAYFDAGADRYLLRHETADTVHYGKLHPEEMSLKNRMRCLQDLKEIGYQTGCGFMVGSPYQTTETLYEDLMFIKELGPAHGGNRAVHPAEGHAVWQGDCGNAGDDPAAAFHPAADASACAAPGDDSARHDPSARAGNWEFSPVPTW